MLLKDPFEVRDRRKKIDILHCDEFILSTQKTIVVAIVISSAYYTYCAACTYKNNSVKIFLNYFAANFLRVLQACCRIIPCQSRPDVKSRSHQEGDSNDAVRRRQGPVS